MLLAKARTFSAKPSLYWSATSTLVVSTIRSTCIGWGVRTPRRRVRGRPTPGPARPAGCKPAVRPRRAALLADRGGGLAPRVFLGPALPVAQHLHPHLRRERIDHAHADAVEAARDLVAATAEL